MPVSLIFDQQTEGSDEQTHAAVLNPVKVYHMCVRFDSGIISAAGLLRFFTLFVNSSKFLTITCLWALFRLVRILTSVTMSEKVHNV